MREDVKRGDVKGEDDASRFTFSRLLRDVSRSFYLTLRVLPGEGSIT